MPATVPIAIVVLASVLILVALLGGRFKVFTTEISSSASRLARVVSGVLGMLLLLTAIGMDQQGKAGPVQAPATDAPPASAIPASDGSAGSVAEAGAPANRRPVAPSTRASVARIPLLQHESPASTTATSPLTGIDVWRGADAEVEYPEASADDPAYVAASRMCERLASPRQAVVDEMEVITWLHPQQDLALYQRIGYDLEMHGFRVTAQTTNTRTYESRGTGGRSSVGVESRIDDGMERRVTWVACLLSRTS